MVDNFKKISDSIKSYAHSKAEEIIERARKVSEKKYIEAKKNINAEIRKERRAFEDKIETEKTKIRSKLEIEFNKERRKIIENLLDKVLVRIKESVFELKSNKNEYEKILITFLQESVKVLDVNDLVIYINPEDKNIFTKDFRKETEHRLECKISEIKYDPRISGGVIVQDSQDPDTLFDNSFDFRVNQIVDELRKEITNLIES